MFLGSKSGANGDRIISRNEKTGKTTLRRVAKTYVRTSAHLLTVTLADKRTGRVVETLQTTRQHPFWVAGKGWVPAGGLAIGNAIVTRAGPALVVKSVVWARRAEGYRVYNFQVEGDHTYFVGKTDGGLWVHNADYDAAAAAAEAAELERLAAQWRMGSHSTLENSLNKHFDVHGGEVGATSLTQYMRKAEGFRQNLRGARSYPSDGYTEGARTYLKDGKYIILDPEGNILSFGRQ